MHLNANVDELVLRAAEDLRVSCMLIKVVTLTV